MSKPKPSSWKVELHNTNLTNVWNYLGHKYTPQSYLQSLNADLHLNKDKLLNGGHVSTSGPRRV